MASVVTSSNKLLDEGDWMKDAFMVKVGQVYTNYKDQVYNSSQGRFSTGDDSGIDVIKKISGSVDSQSQLDFFKSDSQSLSPYYFALGKCRDTTLGGNDVVNPLPQYCRNDDIVPPFNNNPATSCKGEGRVYSRVIDDNQRILYLSFGIPVFNNLMAFYANAADESTTITNDKGFLFKGAKQLTSLFLTPAVIVAKLPVLPLLWLDRLILFDGAPVSKYYDFQSQMPMYYRYVNTILISLAVTMGLMRSVAGQGKAHAFGNGTTGDGSINAKQEGSINPYSASDAPINDDNNSPNTTANADPDSAMSQGSAAVNGMRNGSSQGVTYADTHAENVTADGQNMNSWPDYLIRYQLDVGQILHKRQKFIYGSAIDHRHVATDALINATGGYGKSILSAFGMIEQDVSGYLKESGAGEILNGVGKAMDEGVQAASSAANTATSWISKTLSDGQQAVSSLTGTDGLKSLFDNSGYNLPTFLKPLADGFKVGSQPALYFPLYYVGFRVERGVDTSEQLVNETQRSSVQASLNQKFQEGREQMFNIARGHLFGSSGLTGLIQNSVGSILSGISSGFSVTTGLGGLAALATGSGLIDIPEEWSNSSFSKNYHFNFKFRAPTGNRISIFQSIMYPLSFLMAGSFPRAQGMASYGSPFLCKAYCKGLLSIPLGMISAMTIERGSQVNGWSIDSLPTEVSVSMEIKDLTPVMYMAMGSGGTISGIIKDAENALLGTVDNYNEYLNTLGGLGLEDRFGFAGLMRRVEQFKETVWTARLNRFMLGMQVGQTLPVRALAFLLDTPGMIAHGKANWSAAGQPYLNY